MKKCKVCKSPFEPFNSLQVACGASCALQYVQKEKQKEKQKEQAKLQKESRAWVKVQRERLKSNAQRLNDLQVLVNRYVRQRDSGKPCISCGKPDDGSHQRHASHFRSVGACSSLRFNTLNIHASCAQCNSHRSGNILEYRIGLANRFGPELIDRLECAPVLKRYEREWIERSKKTFRQKLKSQEKQRDAA